MKSKIIRVMKPILSGCIALSWYIGYDGVSALFFGEYSYPKKEEF